MKGPGPAICAVPLGECRERRCWEPGRPTSCEALYRPQPAPTPAVRPQRSGVATRGRMGKHRPRVAAYVQLGAGGVTADGRPIRGRRAGLAELLRQLPADVERVYLLGERPGRTLDGFTRWYSAPLPKGWADDPRGHYLENLDYPVLRFSRNNGPAVELHRAASWGVPAGCSAEQLRAGFEQLGEQLAAAGFKVRPLASPAATGRECFLASIPFGVEWDCLTAEHQELIRATSTQGRVESFFEQLPGQLPGLFSYDGRFMYAALCRGLGVGPAVHDDRPDFDAYAPGRYRVRVTVPAGWDHVGLVGVRDGDRWRYPSAPGETFESWADGAELHLAAEHGWRFEVLERLLFTKQGAGPLQTWAERLVRARERAGEPLVRGMLRAILLHTLGAFQGRDRLITHTVPVDQAERVPADAEGLRLAGETIVYGTRAEGWAAMAHPEWSAQVWARCRRRILAGPGGTGALGIPRGQLVAIRTDAVWAAVDPEWADDGKVGRLRRQTAIRGPITAPRSIEELMMLRG